MGAVDAITFDFWNTLVHEQPRALRDKRIEAWMGILEGEGFAVEREHLDLAFDSLWKRFTASWESGDQYTHVRAVLDILDDLGYEAPADVRDALVGAFTTLHEGTKIGLTDGIADCLHSLKAAGLRLGIICDVGMTPSTVLRRFLDENGVLELFDHWSFSDEVGYYKPSPEIFEHALDGLGGIEPARAAHIGDLRRTDVAGALRMGMLSLRYTGVFDDADFDGPDAHHVVSSHAEVPALLQS